MKPFITLVIIFIVYVGHSQIMNGSFDKNLNSWYISDTISTEVISNHNNKFISMQTRDEDAFIYVAQSFYPIESSHRLKYKTRYNPISESNSGVWVKAIDSLNKNIYFYVKEITPSSKWQTDSIDYLVPDNAHRIQIGIRLSGIGELSIDDISTKGGVFKQSGDNKTTITYLKKIKEIIEKNALHRDSINWISEWENALMYSNYTPDGYYLGAKYLLSQLNDNHSYLSIRTKNSDEINDDKQILIIQKKISDKIAYIKIPPFSSTSTPQNHSFYNKIQNAIKSLDTNSVKYWIIDLRGNYGGNVWPMLGGLSSFLSEGNLGYFEYYQKTRKPWVYKNDSLLTGSNLAYQFPSPSYRLKSSDYNIAILIDSSVASSAEMLSIILKSLPNSEVIGSKTRGLTTGNSSYIMDSKTSLNLTTSKMLNNLGEYEIKVSPTIINENITLTETEIISWFESSEN